MINFSLKIERRKKGGFDTVFNVGSRGDAQKLALLIGNASAGQGLGDHKKYSTALKKNGRTAYKVTFYRSKMRQLASRGSFLYELFKQVRDHNETAPVASSRSRSRSR